MIAYLLLGVLSLVALLAFVTRGRVLLLLLALAASACAGPLDAAVIASNAGQSFAEDVRHELETRHRTEADKVLEAATSPEHGAELRAELAERWAPTWEAYDRVVRALVALRAVVQSAIALEALGVEPDEAKLTEVRLATAEAVAELSALLASEVSR